MSAEVIRILRELSEDVTKQRAAVLSDAGAKYLSSGVRDYEWGYREALNWALELLEGRIAVAQREAAGSTPRRRALPKVRIDPVKPGKK